MADTEGDSYKDNLRNLRFLLPSSRRLTIIYVTGILALVILGGTFASTTNRLPSETTSLVGSSVSSTVVNPEDSSATSRSEKTDVETSVAERSSVAVSKNRSISSFVPGADFMVKQAFAIPSTQTTVTLDEWPIPTADSVPSGITIDASDNVFFLELVGKVGVLQQSSVNPNQQEIVEWTIPTAQTSPSTITIDASHNLFFGEDDANKIARLVPATGVITEWTIPSTSSLGSRPTGVTVDASGNVYFTEPYDNQVGRLVPATGVVTEWTIASSFLRGITTDASGNVYFTDTGDNKIARLVPATGGLTEWTIPTTDSRPTGITIDSTGNVYFVESVGNKIGRLVPATGVITEWTLPAITFFGSVPTGITIDSTGNVYFTEGNIDANKIGRLS